MPNKADLPKYHELMLPTLRAVDGLGGSAKARQITNAVIELLRPAEELVAIEYPGREKSMYLDRLDWARSYCKLGGALESPKRGLFLMTDLGREILAMAPADAAARLQALDSDVRGRRRQKTRTEEPIDDAEAPLDDEEPMAWRQALLERLHAMSPTGFELFVLYLLRTYDLELEHVGGSGDLGLDGIGTAPISPVLSATVAVQVKRYDPTKAIGRDTVALFQRDAAAAGAERAIMVTLSRYTPSARKASQVTTPTVDLIDGEQLCDLVRDQEVGIRVVPEVMTDWFDRFESDQPMT